jgi:L-rhamnose isomerase
MFTPQNIMVTNLTQEQFGYICEMEKQITELQDKLHRRNLQIKDLKAEITKYKLAVNVKGKLMPEDFIG